MVPLVSVPVQWQGAGQGAGQAKCHADTGGGVAIRESWVWHTTRQFFAVHVRVFRPRPDDTSRASGEGLDGRRPPIFDRWRGQPMGLVWHQVWHMVWHTHPPAWGGRSRPYVSLREGSQARARAGRSATPSGPIHDALLRAFLVIGDISAACAWTWPGVFPKADPVAVLVRYHTPNVYAAVVAWYDVAPGVAVFLTGHSSSARRGSGSPGWASVSGSGRAFPRGRFRRRRTARRSSSGRSITRSEPSRARAPNG